MRNEIEQFKDAIQSAGLEPPDVIEPGKMHRFPTNGKRGDDAGWCKMFPDMLGGVFGDHRSGLSDHWQAKTDRVMTQAEREAFRRMVVESKHQAELEERKRHEAAALKAAASLGAATGDPATHPYLLKKRVSLGSLVKRGPWPQRGWSDALLVPIHGVDGRLWSIEAINEDGGKDFLAGGKISGCFHPFGKIRGAGRVLVGEGVATAAVGAEVDQSSAAAALSASNLKAVALAVRELAAPGADIIILADNDIKPGGSNPGVEAAMESARSIGARVVIPELDGRACDFWDLWNEHGIEAVRAAIANAKPPASPEHGSDTENARGGDSARQDRTEPMPLPELPPVPPFPLKVLPKTLRPWIADIADRMQCPPDYPAGACIVMLGALLGNRIGIRPKGCDSWLEVTNLWGAIVGRSGWLKSPALAAVLTPLSKLQHKADEEYKPACEQHEAERMAAEVRRDAAKARAKKALTKDAGAVIDLTAVMDSEPPPRKRYRVNDTSYEKLGVILSENPYGVLVFRDELVGLLRTLDRQGQEGARAFYLEAWNGTNPYTFERILRGSTHIDCCCVSVLGGIQPGAISGYIRQAVDGGVGDDGLMQRFSVLLWPDPKADYQYTDKLPDVDVAKTAFEVVQRLATLDLDTVKAQEDAGSIPYLRFDEVAQVEFKDWLTAHQRRLLKAEDHPALDSHLSKYKKLVPGYALIVHLAEGGTGPVGHGALLKALALSEYLEAHAKRVYASVTMPDMEGARALLRRAQRGDLRSPFTGRDVYRNGWAGLGTVEAVTRAADVLETYHWLRSVTVQPGEQGGRPSVLYYYQGALS